MEWLSNRNMWKIKMAKTKSMELSIDDIRAVTDNYACHCTMYNIPCEEMTTYKRYIIGRWLSTINEVTQEMRIIWDLLR